LAAFFFAAGFFTAMNSPEALLRLVQAVTPPSLFFSCDRFLTAPLRALSATGYRHHHLPLRCRAVAAMINESRARRRFPHRAERFGGRGFESRFCGVGE
jgi:hypothetical protein